MEAALGNYSCFQEPVAQSSATLQRISSALPQSSNLKWVKKQMGDLGLPPPSSTNHAQKLLINSAHPILPFPGSEYCRVGHDIYRIGHDLYACPPKKLRKLLTTVSDGVHIFSCVERVHMSSAAELEWTQEELDLSSVLFSRKRPWHLCGLNWGGCDPAAESSRSLGLRSLYQRLTTHDMSLDIDDTSGSGGKASGGGFGQGGDSNGGDGEGQELPGSGNQGSPMAGNMCGLKDDMEEKEETLIHEIADDENIADLATDIPACVAENVTSPAKNGNFLLEQLGMPNLPHHFMLKVLENLNGGVGSFVLDVWNLLQQGPEMSVGGYSKHIAMLQDDGGDLVVCGSHGGSSLQTDLQAIDQVLADEYAASDSRGDAKDLLGKLRELTLGPAHTQLLHKPHMQADKQVVDQELKCEAALMSTIKGEGDALQEQRPSGVQWHGVFDWFDRLAENTKMTKTGQAGKQDKRDKQNPVDAEKNLKVLVNEAVTTALNQMSETGENQSFAKKADMETLKRLQREVFSELLKLREKLEMMEQMASSSRPPTSGAGKTALTGEVRAGSAFVLLEDGSSRHSRGSLEQAGMQTGVDVRFTFETPFREKDILITECIAGQLHTVGEGRALGGPISLGRVQYVAHINENVSVSFVPIGARGMDVTDVVNPMQDQGLTAFSSQGPAHFTHCKGSAIGSTWSGPRFACSLAEYLSGWGNSNYSLENGAGESGPLCRSTLAQLLLQPTERLVFSLSGVNRFWPSPPLPSSMGLHWSEMGPLVIPKIQSIHTSRSSEDSFVSLSNSLGSAWGMLDSDYHLDAEETKGTSLLSVAVASEIELGVNTSLGAWAQVEVGDGVQDPDKQNFQWALNLSRRCVTGIGWGASIGGSRPDFWSMPTRDQEMYPGYVGGAGDSYGSQLQVEAFLKLNCWKGFTLQPGLLYLLNKHTRTPAFIVRSSWQF